MKHRSDFHIWTHRATFPPVRSDTRAVLTEGAPPVREVGQPRQLGPRRLLILAITAGLVTFAVVAGSGRVMGVVEGLVVAVDGDLRTVRNFELHTTDGSQLRFVPDPNGAFAFPLPHLGTHMRSLDPVSVTFRTAADGTLVAVGLDDA